MIAVVNYGLGNIRSVSKALECAGACVKVAQNSKDIDNAKAIVFPGVGAFSQGMKNLEELDMFSVILRSINKGKPFLGLCLGLQLLFSESEEHGRHKGFDILKGKVKKFKSSMKIPHMGWNNIKVNNQNSCSKIFQNIPDNSYFYFVHSYYVEPQDSNIITATTDYGIEFASAVQKDNIYGLQFHPEKSSKPGLKILENFVKNVK